MFNGIVAANFRALNPGLAGLGSAMDIAKRQIDGLLRSVADVLVRTVPTLLVILWISSTKVGWGLPELLKMLVELQPISASAGTGSRRVERSVLRRVARIYEVYGRHWHEPERKAQWRTATDSTTSEARAARSLSKIVKQLEESLDPKLVDSYTGAGGKEYSYLETNEVINQHNRIFGHGNWYYRVKAGPTLCQVEHVDADTGAIRRGEYYAAIVALYVFDREMFSDEGFGIVDRMKPGASMYVVLENHEKARKGSISDGLKRCSRGLGNQFGNALYSGDERERRVGSQPAHLPQARSRQAHPREQSRRRLLLLPQGQHRHRLLRADAVCAGRGAPDQGDGELRRPRARRTAAQWRSCLRPTRARL